MKQTCLAAIACALVACGSDLEDGSRIDKLRLLALRADEPFAHAGEAIALQLLLVQPDPQPLSYALATCTRPSGSTVQGCLAALDGPFRPLAIEDDHFTLDIADDALTHLPASARPSALVGAVIVACPGEIADGTTAALPLACRDPDGARLPLDAFEVGVKRIFLRERDRNQNPEIVSVRWDGEAWPEDRVPEARACEHANDDIDNCERELKHAIHVETSEAERGVDENGTRFAEQLVVQFYATQGVFERPLRVATQADNHWAAQRLPTTDTAQLWFVVRDDRGGVGWTRRQVRVR